MSIITEIRTIHEFNAMLGLKGSLNILFIYEEGEIRCEGYKQAIRSTKFREDVKIFGLDGKRSPELKKMLGYHGMNILLYFKDGVKEVGPVYMTGGNIDIIWKINDDITKNRL